MQHPVSYPGFEVSGGQRELGPERKEAVCRTPEPAPAKGSGRFLKGRVGADSGFLIMDSKESLFMNC